MKQEYSPSFVPTLPPMEKRESRTASIHDRCNDGNYCTVFISVVVQDARSSSMQSVRLECVQCKRIW